MAQGFVDALDFDHEAVAQLERLFGAKARALFTRIELHPRTAQALGLEQALDVDLIEANTYYSVTYVICQDTDRLLK